MSELPPLERGSVPDMRKAMRNAVVPHEGLEIAQAAFTAALVGAANVEIRRQDHE